MLTLWIFFVFINVTATVVIYEKLIIFFLHLFTDVFFAVFMTQYKGAFKEETNEWDARETVEAFSSLFKHC